MIQGAVSYVPPTSSLALKTTHGSARAFKTNHSQVIMMDQQTENWTYLHTFLKRNESGEDNFHNADLPSTVSPHVSSCITWNSQAQCGAGEDLMDFVRKCSLYKFHMLCIIWLNYISSLVQHLTLDTWCKNVNLSLQKYPGCDVILCSTQQWGFGCCAL